MAAAAAQGMRRRREKHRVADPTDPENSLNNNHKDLCYGQDSAHDDSPDRCTVYSQHAQTRTHPSAAQPPTRPFPRGRSHPEPAPVAGPRAATPHPRPAEARPVHRLPRGAPRLAGVLVLQRPPILTPAADCPQPAQPVLRLRAARRHAPPLPQPPEQHAPRLRLRARAHRPPPRRRLPLRHASAQRVHRARALAVPAERQARRWILYVTGLDWLRSIHTRTHEYIQEQQHRAFRRAWAAKAATPPPAEATGVTHASPRIRSPVPS